ncbi:MAG TPA: hypothetical protein VJR89_27930 [Polyangiales bacterium]|nr:hypothetical protein [Polyangiales bacterium]
MCAALVRAQTPPESYERQRADQYLASVGRREDPAPEGKRIRRLEIVRREVFEGDDLLVPIVLPRFASTWPNFFHVLTTEHTIRRELLLSEGDRYDAALVEESVRNLLGLGIIGLVRIVPVLVPAEPDSVDLVVYTRDLWSLRLEEEFSGAGRSFELAAQLVERNFLGRDKALSGRFLLKPDKYTFGQTYADPRLFGESLRLAESFDLIFNRATGTPEGSVGGLAFGRPFYNLAQRFSFELNIAYSDQIWRDIRNGELLGYDASPGPKHGQNCSFADEDCIRLIWDEWRLRVNGAVHYRVGERYTMTFSAGAGLFDLQTGANAETRLHDSQAQVYYDEVLPPSRRDVYPYVRYRLSLPDYVVFTNLGMFGLAEPVQVGPQLDATLSTPLEVLGSSGDSFIAQGYASYVWVGSDMLVQPSAEVWTRLDRGAVIDQRAFLQLRAASPSLDWLWGRLVFRAFWDGRRNDSQRALVALGGSNGLRGYPAQFSYGRGASRVLSNLEYRTRPWLLQSIHIGLVAFYDAGVVYPALYEPGLHHGVGAGLRVLFPQFNRSVFRLDVGHAVGEPGFSVLLTYGGDQVVALTPEEDRAAITSIGPSL